jgi:transposase
MPRQLRIRGLDAAEQAEIEKRARSSTAEVRQVERAQIVDKASAGQTVKAIATELRMKEGKVRFWIRRLNAQGVAHLPDQPRSGRPAT